MMFRKMRKECSLMNSSSYMTPISVKSAVDILIDRLTQAIIDGTLKPGERIPTEPELAANFGVGRNTVREAVRTLTAYGILEVRRPNGTFVCNTFKPQGINPMLYGLILQREDSYRELIDLRKVFENGVLLLLAEKPLTSEQKKYLRDIASELEDTIKSEPVDCKKIIDKDIGFHTALAEMTDNKLIILENNMISKLTYQSRLKTVEKVIEDGKRQYLIDTHYDLLEKLDSGDISQLYQAIQNSYFYWKDIYK